MWKIFKAMPLVPKILIICVVFALIYKVSHPHHSHYYSPDPVSPAPAAYLTIEPNFSIANPLAVNNLLPFGTITARDQFGNVATGDPKNGQYYTGTVNFTTSGSTNTVTLVEAEPSGVRTCTSTAPETS